MKDLQSKVKKLLALSSSENKHEAEQALKRANKLILQHNIDLSKNSEPIKYFKSELFIGKRRPIEHFQIATILNNYFFVKCLLRQKYNYSEGHRENYLVCLGTKENVENALYIYKNLSVTFKQLSKGIKTKGHFYDGLMVGFQEKLQEQKGELEERGLVVVPDKGLNKYKNQLYPNTSNVRTSQAPNMDAYNNGKALGRNISVAKPLERNNKPVISIA